MRTSEIHSDFVFDLLLSPTGCRYFQHTFYCSSLFHLSVKSTLAGLSAVIPSDTSIPRSSNSCYQQSSAESYIHPHTVPYIQTKREPEEKRLNLTTLNQLFHITRLNFLHMPFVYLISQSSIDTEKPIQLNSSQNAASITIFVSTARNLNTAKRKPEHLSNVASGQTVSS